MSSPLFIRSVYSLLSSLCNVEGIITKCKEYNYSSVSLVDKNVLSGALNFYHACQKNNLKAIFGLEVEIDINNRNYPLVLYAKDDDGFKNLMGLSTYICTNDNKIINKEILDKYKANNFIVLLSDNMPLRIALDKNEDIKEMLKIQETYFGNDYLVGLMDHNIEANKIKDIEIKKILKEENIKSLALCRTYYLEKDDYIEYEILRCIDEKRTIDDLDNIFNEGRYFYEPDYFNSLYDKEELINTDTLAMACNVSMSFKTSMPIYENKYNVSSKEFLINICQTVLKQKFNNQIPDNYVKRLKKELTIINDMDFANYFLIVYDFIHYAKKNNILVGPGRGSAAGSLVAYCLGITDIDPLKYGLLFERFLNPERITMPDIDTDFPDDKRQLVIDYVKNKYHKEHFAHVITYGTLKAKQVLRDVGRVLNYKTGELDTLTKLLPNDPKLTLLNAFNEIPTFKKKISDEKRYQRLFEIACKLEGKPRHESTHAAGFVMSLKPLTEVIPLIKIEDDVYSTQYTMEYLEELGLIKMDFLSIRNLSIMENIIEDINKKEDLNIHKISLDDYKTFSLIANANTLGIFQLESKGMMSLLKRMKPKNFEEIAVAIALHRPGPMKNINNYLYNRENHHMIKYLHDDLKDILEETYGIIIYQEQIMNIARKMAGFSYAKADTLRNAMSKKKLKELVNLKEDFINGCIMNHYDHKLSEDIYDLILEFANYGFNKSHSIVYAMVAYQMAYLKANYPLEFYKSLLSGVIGAENKTYEYITELKTIGLNIHGISINKSLNVYEVIDDEIIMPFTICKDLGLISANKIIAEREKNGLFKDYIDAIRRLIIAQIDKNIIENLIYAGAFDEFGYNRNTLIKALPNAMLYANAHKNETNILEELDDKPQIIEYPSNKLVIAENEKKVLGFYLTYNPINMIKEENNIICDNLYNIVKMKGFVKGFGLIKNVKRITTKTNKPMAFVDIIDETANLSLTFMPNIYLIHQDVLQKDKYIYFEGNIENIGSCLVKKANIY